MFVFCSVQFSIYKNGGKEDYVNINITEQICGIKKTQTYIKYKNVQIAKYCRHENMPI